MRKQSEYYDKYKRDKQSTEFYKSKSWKQLRDAAFNRDHGLCQRCLKAGDIVPADVVHHIVEIKTDWNKRLDINNLESICHSCHNKEHKAANREINRKIKAIKG
jgi:5-methylcytosine-specific restriction enzyme A